MGAGDSARDTAESLNPCGLLSVSAVCTSVSKGRTWVIWCKSFSHFAEQWPGALNISRYLWSLCYQNCTHKFPETPGGAGPPLAAPLLENQVVRGGLTKGTLKVKPECEEGASSAKTWGMVVQPEEAASAMALWHKGTGYVPRKMACLAEKE